MRIRPIRPDEKDTSTAPPKDEMRETRTNYHRIDPLEEKRIAELLGNPTFSLTTSQKPSILDNNKAITIEEYYPTDDEPGVYSIHGPRQHTLEQVKIVVPEQPITPEAPKKPSHRRFSATPPPTFRNTSNAIHHIQSQPQGRFNTPKLTPAITPPPGTPSSKNPSSHSQPILNPAKNPKPQAPMADFQKATNNVPSTPSPQKGLGAFLKNLFSKT